VCVRERECLRVSVRLWAWVWNGRERRRVLVRPCSLTYLARKAHLSYYIVMCGLSGSIIFSTLSHKRHGFREKVLNIKRVF
jgi:hypothetical protein